MLPQFKGYKPIEQDGVEKQQDDEDTIPRKSVVTIRKMLGGCGKDACIVALMIVIMILLCLLITLPGSRRGNDGDSTYWGGQNDLWTQYSWFTRYSKGQEESKIDDSWNSIVPAYGIVAVDQDWAAEQRLPDTMALPSDASKGVYIIDAYHQLHCLTIIRRTFRELQQGLNLTTPIGHSIHCFDSLRQHVMCSASDTLLYTWGRNITGDGQVRKCRNWDSLRQWAGKHSACYKDFDHPTPILDHFGHCGQETDGLESDQWLPLADSHHG